MTDLPDRPQLPRFPAAWGHALALAACALVTAIGLPLARALDHANIAMVYLLVVALVALRLGRDPAIVASVASVLLFDFFFVEPRFSFAVADAQYLITFGVMFAVALIVGTLAARLREDAREAASREMQMRALYGLAHELTAAREISAVARTVNGFLDRALDVESVVLVDDGEGRLRGAAGEAEGALGDVAVARRVHASGEALPFVDRATGAAGLALPLVGPVHARGVLVARARDRDVVAGAAQRPLLDAVAALAGAVIERIHFVAVAHDAQLDAESERLRALILSAVSHDLRTPLTLLVGLSDTLASSPLGTPAAATAASLRDEAMRMARLVDNLLDLARLQSGRVALRKAWQPLDEVIATSVAAVEREPGGKRITIDMPPDLPLVEIDAVLVERVIVNLLDNVRRHAPRAGVRIRVRVDAEAATVEVEDDGPGIPEDRLMRLFHPFEPAPAGGRGRAGLGLAICEAIVRAHGGAITAQNRPEGGARFAFTLPAGRPPVPAEAADPSGPAHA